MVNYGRIYALRKHLQSIDFQVWLTTYNEPITGKHYVGFEVDGIKSFGCWREDEQVAVNIAADHLAEIYSELVYWTNKSK